MDDDECAMSCSSNATLACPASGEHHDPVAPIHSCDCMCHVPGVAMNGPTIGRPDARVDMGSVPIVSPLNVGFLEPPFHPPRA